MYNGGTSSEARGAAPNAAGLCYTPSNPALHRCIIAAEKNKMKLPTSTVLTTPSRTVSLTDQKAYASILTEGNKNKHFIAGNSYLATLIEATDCPSDIGGPTGRQCVMVFDIAGVRMVYRAALPSSHISFAACTKLRKALNALGWESGQKITSLVGRSVWVTIGEKYGREIISGFVANINV